MVAEPCPDGQNHPQHMAESRLHGQIRPLFDRRWSATRRYQYTSYKVANFLVEYSTSIPRTQLRPGYGDGFLGAPLQMRQPPEHPTPREQGEQRGSSSTQTQQNSGSAPHVCAEPGERCLCGAGVCTGGAHHPSPCPTGALCTAG